jgi:acetyl-CoA acetyltransferase
MPEAVIVDALRTPIGRHAGVLSCVRPDDLAAHVIQAAVERGGLDPASVDDVYMGATNAAGEDNRNVARMASLLAGLAVEVPGVTVNRLCAACVTLMSGARARELGKEPLARIVASASAGVDPAYMGIGPVPATRGALARAGLEPADIDLVELNEAFASQVLASMRELGFDHDRLNVNGGAIALGHPLGCSGARLIGTLAHELRRRGGRYGVATMCIGVGQGMAAVIENPAA